MPLLLIFAVSILLGCLFGWFKSDLFKDKDYKRVEDAYNSYKDYLESDDK